MNRLIAFADRQLNRQVFLDGDLLFEVGIEREVGDTEATLTENLDDLVPLDTVARLKGITMDFRHGRLFLSLPCAQRYGRLINGSIWRQKRLYLGWVNAF